MSCVLILRHAGRDSFASAFCTNEGLLKISKPAPRRDAVLLIWTLSWAKNCSPALNFYTSVRTGAALSSPPSI